MSFANIVIKRFFSHEYNIFEQRIGHLRYDKNAKELKGNNF